jgi:hypothetical protein
MTTAQAVGFLFSIKTVRSKGQSWQNAVQYLF